MYEMGGKNGEGGVQLGKEVVEREENDATRYNTIREFNED